MKNDEEMKIFLMELNNRKQEYFERSYNNFFMIDLHPENKERFKITLEDMAG